MKIRYVIARGANKRPTLQHLLRMEGSNGIASFMTACGREIAGWSRAYQEEAIPEVLCLYCKKLEEEGW